VTLDFALPSPDWKGVFERDGVSRSDLAACHLGQAIPLIGGGGFKLSRPRLVIV
jgi:hypothetical protein